MSRRLLVACLGGLLAAAAGAQTLYTVAPQSNLLRTIDPATAATTGSIAMTLAGETIDGATGLATHPASNVLYVVLKLEGAPGRQRTLATVDPATGITTAIGNLGDAFAGIAFDCAGNLYGVTGDGADVPETLFDIDPTTAATTLLVALGRGDDGETIGFSPATPGLLYHASGHVGDYDPVTDEGVIFESIDLTTFAITDIPIAGTDLVDEEAQALAWWEAQNVFLWKQNHASGPLFRVTLAGLPTLIGEVDHQAKGLAFVPTFSCDGAPGPPGPSVLEIPTMRPIGLVVLAMLMALAAAFIFARR